MAENQKPKEIDEKQRKRRARPSKRKRNSKKRSSGNATDVPAPAAVTSRVGCSALEANGKKVAERKLRTVRATNDMATSKHQEVEVLENWEEIAENSDVLEKKFRNLKPPSQNKCNGMNGQYDIILSPDDALRSQYVQPEPTVTILKRPTKQNRSDSENKVVQPKKTLQQREQEYAIARRRILGDPASPERAEDTNSNRFGSIQQPKLSGRPTPSTKACHQQQQQQHHQQQQVHQQQVLLLQPQPSPQEENVIRLPKGPDGSKGFVKR